MLRWQILHTGSAGNRVTSTVSLVIDPPRVVVIDPGMVPSQRVILEPLAAAGFTPDLVTDVIISHHHPDHTMNVGLFPEAEVHDYWAIYHHDQWLDRPAEGRQVSPHVRLIETPGHTREDITTLVETPEAVVAFTHLWWHSEGPELDPYATDQSALETGRRRVMGAAGLVV
ncbi:MAG TPA: MBL fold metallo-hydrolase, partial [Acidimicrobiia bacterium]|nr:MBL fold metallo-hydrolase [Acidimicrobiia bacterium]